ncbi:MAG: hypothetical protein SOH81_07940 [Acetobacter sp.]|jgi:hypothetical protein
MIDVFGLAGALTGGVNPQTCVEMRISTGSTENDDGSPSLSYEIVSIPAEIQALSSEDLKQIQNISQQADMRAVYLFGAARALNRPLQIGGDVLIFYGSSWLVTQSLEEWGNNEWSKVLVTRQMDTS